MSSEALTDTADHPPASPGSQAPQPASPIPSVDVDIAGQTDTGKVRNNNEDNFLVVRFGRYLRTMVTSLPEDHRIPDYELGGVGMAVADGMGGMAAGEVASRLALTVLIDLVLETPDWIMSQDEPHVEEVVARAIRRFGRVHQAVLEEARQKPWLRGMGTTLTMACSLGASMLIAHVGDSPVYLLRRGGLNRLTRDHTVAQEMADHGSIPLEAVPPRYRHVLTQAIGVRETGGEPDVHRLTLEDGDRLLMCTDGLTDMVDDGGIALLLKSADSSEAACRSLVDLALERGGRDNVTVVVATFRIAPPA